MRAMKGQSTTDQRPLRQFEDDLDSQQREVGLPEAFRRIYYHLYSNSRASRAELIIEDLSLLLLSKLSVEMNGGKAALSLYLRGRGTADEVLLPMVRESFPGVLGAEQTFSLGDEPLRLALSELARTDLTNAPAHAVGEAFQALIGPRLRGERGQFFTPLSLVRAMVEILDPQPDERVCDPAAGTGGFLAETHIYQLKRHGPNSCSGDLVGVDKDPGLVRFAQALLSILNKDRARMYSFNSLSLLEWEKHTGKSMLGAFDVVLTNPPFGSKIGIKEEKILRQFHFGHVWTRNKNRDCSWVQTDVPTGSQDPQILFFELCVRALKPGGRMGIVLPEGVFGNKQTSYIWDWLERQGDILALLDCPRTTFQPGTDTKTNVLFFRRKNEGSRKPKNHRTQIAVALHCGHDRRGRVQKSDGEAHPDDFPIISGTFRSRQNDRSPWRKASLKGKRYLVPRYHYEDIDASWPEECEITEGAQFVTLRELVEEKIITLCKGHEVGSEFYGTGEIPFVRTSDLSNFEISTDPTKAVSESVYELYRHQQKLKTGDVLIVNDGRYRIGATAILTEYNVRCVVQSHLRIISVLREGEIAPYELLFALNLPSIKFHIRSLIFIQSTLGTIGNRLMELRIPVLHGPGPWSERIERFQKKLRRRSVLLADLKGMFGPDYAL